MKRRTIARVIAVILLSYAFAFVLVDAHKTDMARYRTLSREALLADLAGKSDADFSKSFGEGLLAVGVIVALIEGMTSLIELTINRIAPPLPPSGAAFVADVGDTRTH